MKGRHQAVPVKEKKSRIRIKLPRKKPRITWLRKKFYFLVRNKLALTIASIILALSFFAGILYFKIYATNSLIDVIQKQLQAIRTGNMTQAYSYTSPDFQDVTTLNKFKQFVNAAPQLKFNQNIQIQNSRRDGDEGVVVGILQTKEGKTAQVQYHLIRHDNQWKVFYIHLTRTAGTDTTDVMKNVESVPLTKVFDSKENYYTIKYPDEWIYETLPNRKVVFSGPKGTPSYDSTVTIQAFASEKAKGNYGSIDEVIADFKKQLAEVAFRVKLLDQGDVSMPTNPNGFRGKYLIFSYIDQGYVFKKLQFILERNDGKAFYTFGYTSPFHEYPVDLPTAKAMFASWEIE